jgi:hypothetical protein
MISWLISDYFWAGKFCVHVLMQKPSTSDKHHYSTIWFCELLKKHFLTLFLNRTASTIQILFWLLTISHQDSWKELNVNRMRTKLVCADRVYTLYKSTLGTKRMNKTDYDGCFFLLLTHSDVSRLSPLSLCSFKCLVVACILFSFPLVKWITSRKRYSRVRAGTVATIH